MKTTILDYEAEKVTDSAIQALGFDGVRDYNSKRTDVYSLAQEYSSMLMRRALTANDTPERISHDLYGTPDYWDILVLLNDRDPLFGMFYSDDLIIAGADEKVSVYAADTYANAPLGTLRAKQLQAEFRTRLMEQNDARSDFLVVKPSRINDFIAVLRQRGFIK